MRQCRRSPTFVLRVPLLRQRAILETNDAIRQQCKASSLTACDLIISLQNEDTVSLADDASEQGIWPSTIPFSRKICFQGRIRTKHKCSSPPTRDGIIPTPDASNTRALPPLPCSTVSLPIFEAIRKSHSFLTKFYIVSIISGQTSELALLEGLSNLLGSQILKVTSFRPRQFEASFKLEKDAPVAKELRPFNLNSKHGPCSM